ncbi:hypothetical protein Micbo1qcDRAFT_174537 [Microdochium bolleyi]|uniref:Uncharacterized protein n=1 Tax=Microdochium bolleyi TaxID=196109 RepID=A0A136J8L4_9PEZI|nr:hypothetical protein Micbo1qcDRAFT_174537 [Microdochium bolleyi]
MAKRPNSAAQAATAQSAAPRPPTVRPPRTRRPGQTLLFVLSAALALGSIAVAAGLQQHQSGHETTHQALRHRKLALRHEAAGSSAATVTASASAPSPPTTATCVPDGSKNPISYLWPNDISGNLNGTTLIVPIPLVQARQAIPEKYGILEHAWRAWLPDFPVGMYPMMAVSVYDHDLRFPVLNMTPPDFSRMALEFPFVDVLNDGHTSFRWAANMLITAGSPAIKGTEDFGVTVYPAAFDPPCNAYRASEREPGLVTSRAWASSKGTGNNTSPATDAHQTGNGKCGGDHLSRPWQNAERSLYFETRPTLHDNEMPYPLRFLVNITNQPVFANPSICDNYKRLFNTTLTMDPANAPVSVRGDVVGNVEPFFTPPAATGLPPLHHKKWSGVYGWRLSTGFLEPPVPGTCDKLKGYEGTGPGDSALP